MINTAITAFEIKNMIVMPDGDPKQYKTNHMTHKTPSLAQLCRIGYTNTVYLNVSI